MKRNESTKLWHSKVIWHTSNWPSSWASWVEFAEEFESNIYKAVCPHTALFPLNGSGGFSRLSVRLCWWTTAHAWLVAGIQCDHPAQLSLAFCHVLSQWWWQWSEDHKRGRDVRGKHTCNSQGNCRVDVYRVKKGKTKFWMSFKKNVFWSCWGSVGPTANSCFGGVLPRLLCFDQV